MQREALETASNSHGNTSTCAPVDTLASFEIRDDLRAMLEGTMESPEVLPLMYLGFRERLNSLASGVPDRSELESRLKSTQENPTGDQDLLLSVRIEIREVRASLEALRENSQDLHLQVTRNASDVREIRTLLAAIMSAKTQLFVIVCEFSSPRECMFEKNPSPRLLIIIP